MEIGKKERKDPTLAKNKRPRMGHPKAFFGIKARPPASSVVMREFVGKSGDCPPGTPLFPPLTLAVQPDILFFVGGS